MAWSSKCRIAMEVLYLIIPLSVILIAVIIWVFMWAVRSGQFDDLEGPAHRILMEEDIILNDDSSIDDTVDGQESGRSARSPGASRH